MSIYQEMIAKATGVTEAPELVEIEALIRDEAGGTSTISGRTSSTSSPATSAS